VIYLGKGPKGGRISKENIMAYWLEVPEGMVKTYSVKEAAQVMGVSPKTVYNWIRNGSLEVRRLTPRGKIFIPESSITPLVGAK
jgi:excisionase family DNA binding protein